MRGSWKRTFGLAFGLVYLLAMVACTGSPYSRGTGEYVNDKAISTQVNAKLMADQTTKAHQINVETYRGAVQLSGFVDSQQSVQRATEIAQSVEGVKSVQNNLIVKQPKMQQQLQPQ